MAKISGSRDNKNSRFLNSCLTMGVNLDLSGNAKKLFANDFQVLRISQSQAVDFPIKLAASFGKSFLTSIQKLYQNETNLI